MAMNIVFPPPNTRQIIHCVVFAPVTVCQPRCYVLLKRVLCKLKFKNNNMVR